jgi:hypothetical protein
MLIALLPDQVATYWPAIKAAIEQSAPPVAKQDLDMNKVLESIMMDQLQVWILENDNEKIVAVVTTTVTEDFCSSSKSLLIYSLFGISTIGPRLWREGFETLKAHAKALGCSRIVAFTTEEVVRKLVKFFGGDDSYTYVRMEV